jgi:hypothetical protein
MVGIINQGTWSRITSSILQVMEAEVKIFLNGFSI